jgi:hypothetical protein
VIVPCRDTAGQRGRAAPIRHVRIRAGRKRKFHDSTTPPLRGLPQALIQLALITARRMLACAHGGQLGTARNQFRYRLRVAGVVRVARHPAVRALVKRTEASRIHRLHMGPRVDEDTDYFGMSTLSRNVQQRDPRRSVAAIRRYARAQQLGSSMTASGLPPRLTPGRGLLYIARPSPLHFRVQEIHVR